MRIFAIRDESEIARKDLGYLLYYEADKQFYIELPSDADPWTTPLLLDSFVQRGEYTVNAYWSKIWVQQRIIPPDRQNLDSILRDNGLEEYDEFQFLMFAMGRCAQDDYYLEEVYQYDLPEEIKQRFARRVKDVLTLDGFSLLVFFQDGTTKKCSLKEYFAETSPFQILLQKPDCFPCLKIQTGGHGVSWDVNMAISDATLCKMGASEELDYNDFIRFASTNTISAAEASEMLCCSRQNIQDLVKRGKLHPVKSFGRNTLYLKSEVEQRLWK